MVLLVVVVVFLISVVLFIHYFVPGKWFPDKYDHVSDYYRLYKNGHGLFVLDKFVYGSMSEGWTNYDVYNTLEEAEKHRNILIANHIDLIKSAKKVEIYK